MPALDVLIVALAALLVTFAWALIFGRALAAVRAHVPGIFVPLVDALIAADSAVYNALRQWADPAVRPFTDFLQRLIAAAEALTVGPLAFARATYAALERLFNVTVPWVLTTANDLAARLFAQAEQAAEALFQGLAHDLAGLVAQVAGLGQALEVRLEQVVESVRNGLHQAFDYALNLAREVARYAEALVGQEAARAVAAEQAVEAAAGADVARVEAEVQAWAAEVRLEVGNIAAGLESEVEQARRELGAEVVNFEDLVKQRIQAVIDSSPLQLAERLGEAGAAALAADVEALVVLSAAEIRKQLGSAEQLRARYGPQIEAAFGHIRSKA